MILVEENATIERVRPRHGIILDSPTWDDPDSMRRQSFYLREH